MTTNRPVTEESLQTARSWVQRHMVVDGEGSGPPGESFIGLVTRRWGEHGQLDCVPATQARANPP